MQQLSAGIISTSAVYIITCQQLSAGIISTSAVYIITCHQSFSLTSCIFPAYFMLFCFFITGENN